MLRLLSPAGNRLYLSRIVSDFRTYKDARGQYWSNHRPTSSGGHGRRVNLESKPITKFPNISYISYPVPCKVRCAKRETVLQYQPLQYRYSKASRVKCVFPLLERSSGASSGPTESS